MHAHYDIHGTSVALRWDDPGVGRVLAEVLRYFGLAACEALAAPDLTLSFSTVASPPAVPEEAVQAAEYDGGITAWRADGGLLLRAGSSVVRLSPGEEGGRGYVDAALLAEPRASRRTLTGLLVLSLFALLRRRQRYPLHAAALVKDDLGVLLAAESDSGKSTLSYSLVRQGWQYLSDDSVLLRADGPEIEALAFRRHFGLDPEAEAYFPEIASTRTTQLFDEEKWCIPVDRLYPAQAADRCVPRVLLFPQIVDRPESELVAVRPTDALLALAGQSAMVTLEPAHAPRHLETLKRLVGQTRHYRLLAGRDLKRDPLLIAPLIERLLPRREAVPSWPDPTGFENPSGLSRRTFRSS